MSPEKPDNQQWLEDNQSYFIKAGEIADKIGAQNQLHFELVESGQVTIEPFQEAATEYLTDEQSQTFKYLLEAEAIAPSKIKKYIRTPQLNPQLQLGHETTKEIYRITR